MVKINKTIKVRFLSVLAVLLCMAISACKVSVDEENVSLKTLPDKTEYYIGDTLDYTGLVITATQEDHTEIEVTNYEIEPAAGTLLDKEGSVKVVVTYKNKTVDFEIKVKPADLIYIKAIPEKTYYEGDALDLSEVELEVVKGESTETVTDYLADPEDGTIFEKSGKQVVTLTYCGKSIDYEIDVNPVETSEIYLKTIPQSAYYAGEKLNLDDLEIEVLKNNGTKETVTDFTSEPENGAVLEMTDDGKQTVTITYDSHSFSFEVSIYDVELDKLSVKNMPELISYYTNDVLDLSGLKVEGTFNDDSTQEITGFTTEPENLSLLTEEGKKTIKVKFLDKETDFEVSVQQSIFRFTDQPQNKSYPIYTEGQCIDVTVLVDGTGTMNLSLYRKNPGESDYTLLTQTEDQAVEFGKEYSKSFTLPQNNYVTVQYFCRAQLTKGVTTKSVDSEICTVEQTVNTGLATVYINTKNFEELVNKTDKIKSSLILNDKDGNNLLTDNVTFSGRGNSTWGAPKKPYKIKLSEKKAVLGMPEHKQWMLIANYLDMSFMKNEVAFYLSEQLNMDWTIHGKFVSLVKNGEYLGLYWIGEQIKVDENRVNIDKDNDYLIELDVYYDEEWKFKSDCGLPYQIKNDDSMNLEKLSYLENKIHIIENLLYGGDFPYADSSKISYDLTYLNYIDLDSFAKFYLVNEIMYNCELNWPKSCYFIFDKENNILKAGPVWDFDWAAYTSDTTMELKNSLYYYALFTTKDFNDCVNVYKMKLKTDEVINRISELSSEIKNGVYYDRIRWGNSDRNPIGPEFDTWEEYVNDLCNCVITRLTAVQNTNYETLYCLTE